MPSSFINAIGTALPIYRTSQSDILSYMLAHLSLSPAQARTLKALYKATAIDTRYSVIPDFQPITTPNTQNNYRIETTYTADRMLAYRQHAPILAEIAVRNALEKLNGFDIRAITHLITVSCTGMYAPGIDIDLVKVLGLKPSTERFPINFAGCYGAFTGLRTADHIVRANPKAVVLVVCTELCSLHLSHQTTSDFLLSGALFGDGSAACIVSGQPTEMQTNLKLSGFFTEFYDEGANEMAWAIGNQGFEMKLSGYVPTLLGKAIPELLAQLFARLDITRNDIDLFAIHPGGKAILEATERVLNITKDDNQFSYEVLSDCGNMSSATVLFVLEKHLANRTNKLGQKMLTMAFGPGLTLETAVLEIA
jgi:alpha-pyrone synthase